MARAGALLPRFSSAATSRDKHLMWYVAQTYVRYHIYDFDDNHSFSTDDWRILGRRSSVSNI